MQMPRDRSVERARKLTTCRAAICGFPTQQACGNLQVTCDMYCTYTYTYIQRKSPFNFPWVGLTQACLNNISNMMFVLLLFASFCVHSLMNLFWRVLRSSIFSSPDFISEQAFSTATFRVILLASCSWHLKSKCFLSFAQNCNRIGIRSRPALSFAWLSKSRCNRRIWGLCLCPVFRLSWAMKLFSPS